jgi:porphobilinogen synthase
MAFPDTRLRRLRRTGALRELVRETDLRASRLIAPLFVCSAEQAGPIEAMPGVSRLTISAAVEAAVALERLGVGGVLLFGIPDH